MFRTFFNETEHVNLLGSSQTGQANKEFKPNGSLETEWACFLEFGAEARVPFI